jgi:hypothetical protein
MAHNPAYRLNRIEKVQEVYRQHSKQDVPGTKIYSKHIEPVFHISYRTFTNYLAVNVALARKKLQDDYVNNDRAHH